MQPPDPSPKTRSKINLSRLRDIGWSKWDPIGLLAEGQDWRDETCQAFADEYDSYLLEAAGQLRAGIPDDNVVRYLIDIEANHMGLRAAEGAKTRAQKVVAAIQADEALWTSPD